MVTDMTDDVTRARLRLFRWHLIAYFGVTAVLLALNLGVLGGPPWSLLFLVGWGAPLAVHCAYVMGLFGRPD